MVGGRFDAKWAVAGGVVTRLWALLDPAREDRGSAVNSWPGWRPVWPGGPAGPPARPRRLFARLPSGRHSGAAAACRERPDRRPARRMVAGCRRAFRPAGWATSSRWTRSPPARWRGRPTTASPGPAPPPWAGLATDLPGNTAFGP